MLSHECQVECYQPPRVPKRNGKLFNSTARSEKPAILVSAAATIGTDQLSSRYVAGSDSTAVHAAAIPSNVGITSGHDIRMYPSQLKYHISLQQPTPQ